MLVRSIVLPAGERGGGCSSWKSRCYWIGGSSCALVRVISATKGNEVDRASGIFRPAMAQYLSELDSLAFGRLAQRERRCLTSTRSGVQIPYRPPLTRRPPAMGVFFYAKKLAGFEPRERKTAQWAVFGRAGRRPAQARRFAQRICKIPYRPPLTRRPPAMGVFFCKTSNIGSLFCSPFLPAHLQCSQ